MECRVALRNVTHPMAVFFAGLANHLVFRIDQYAHFFHQSQLFRIIAIAVFGGLCHLCGEGICGLYGPNKRTEVWR